VHFGARYPTDGVAFFLCGGSTKPDPARTSRAPWKATSLRRTSSGFGGQGIEPGSFAEILRAMRAGHSYANIHTTRWPGGETRGQINNEDQKEFDG
jgi:hypothetical protein